MIIINYLLFMVVGVGITNLVVNATILDYPREMLSRFSQLLKKLLSCMMCAGFWVGFLLSILFGINPIFSGAIISLLSHMYSYFLEYMDLTIALKAKELENLTNEQDEDVDG